MAFCPKDGVYLLHNYYSKGRNKECAIIFDIITSVLSCESMQLSVTNRVVVTEERTLRTKETVIP